MADISFTPAGFVAGDPAKGPRPSALTIIETVLNMLAHRASRTGNLDADLVAGLAPSETAVASTLVSRDSSGNNKTIKMAAGQGIDFSAASGDATGMTGELLSDYEEGTWTPTYVSAAGAFGAVTYDALTYGRYRKLNGVVDIYGTLRTDAITVGTASGAVSIGGLPFACSSVTNPGLFVSYAVAFGGDMPEGGLVTISSSQAALMYRDASDGASIALDVSDLATGANANFVVFHASYTV